MLDFLNSVFAKVATIATGLLISIGLVAQPTPPILPQVVEDESTTLTEETVVVENSESELQNEQEKNLAQLNKQVEVLKDTIQNLKTEVKEKGEVNKAPTTNVVNEAQQIQSIDTNPVPPQLEPFISINPSLNTQNALFLLTASSSNDLKLQYLKFKIAPDIFKSKLPRYSENGPIKFSFAIEKFNDPANLNPYDLSYRTPQNPYSWYKIFEKVTEIELPARLQAALYDNSGSCLDDVTGKIITCFDLINVWAERLSVVEFGGLSSETSTIPAAQTIRLKLNTQAKILECEGIEIETKNKVFCK